MIFPFCVFLGEQEYPNIEFKASVASEGVREGDELIRENDQIRMSFTLTRKHANEAKEGTPPPRVATYKGMRIPLERYYMLVDMVQGDDEPRLYGLSPINVFDKTAKEVSHSVLAPGPPMEGKFKVVFTVLSSIIIGVSAKHSVNFEVHPALDGTGDEDEAGDESNEGGGSSSTSDQPEEAD